MLCAFQRSKILIGGVRERVEQCRNLCKEKREEMHMRGHALRLIVLTAVLCVHVMGKLVVV